MNTLDKVRLDLSTLKLELTDQFVSDKWSLAAYSERFDPIYGRRVGELTWEPDRAPYKVEWIWTHPDYRRQGIATLIWREANRRAEAGDCPHPTHSRTQTPEGHEWIRSVGGAIVPGNIIWV